MARRALLTGGAGFVGAYLIAELRTRGTQVTGLYEERRAPSRPGARWVRCDIRDVRALTRVMQKVRPDLVFHLAARTFVPDGESDPKGMWSVNVDGTWSVLEAVSRGAPKARVLLVSTAEAYGRSALRYRPIPETAPLRPSSLYAASKAAGEALGAYYTAARALHVVTVRAFNHTGPGQPPRFLAPLLARQVAEAERAGKPGVLRLGNLHPIRDFLDVRDVVRAYAQVLDRAPAGEIVNVCSGNGRSVREIAQLFCRLSRVPLRIVSVPTARRLNDLSINVGDPRKLRRLTGFRREIPFRRTARDLVDHFLANPGL